MKDKVWLWRENRERFEAMWSKHQDFKELMVDEWHGSKGSYLEKIEIFISIVKN